jgi:hypothetical protein
MDWGYRGTVCLCCHNLSVAHISEWRSLTERSGARVVRIAVLSFLGLNSYKQHIQITHTHTHIFDSYIRRKYMQPVLQSQVG